MTLLGPDISHHQNDAGLDLGKLLASTGFVLIKATQGTGYVDPKFAVNMAAARAAGKLRGAYHFAGDTGKQPGSPTAEADHFVTVAGHQPGEVLVLDWEPTKPPADPDGWCAAFLARVRDRTGVVPMVYMSEAVTRQGTWAKTRALNPGLWVARYGPNTGTKPAITLNVGAWGGYAMWQYTSNGRLPGAAGVLDLNEFYGDAAAWLAYGGRTPTTPAQKDDDMPLSPDDVQKIVDAVTHSVLDIDLGGGSLSDFIRAERAKALTGDNQLDLGKLTEVLRPMLLEAVQAGMGADNAATADEIVNRLAERIRPTSPAS